MPSIFTVTAIKKPERVSTMLKERLQAGNGCLMLPIWIRHHWIAGYIRKRALFVADSAPGHASTKDLQELHKFIQKAINRPLDLIFLRVPRQPRQSMERGIHMVTNLLLLHKNALLEVDDTTFVSLASVRTALNNVTRGTITPNEAYQHCKGAMAFQASNVETDAEPAQILEEYGPGYVTILSVCRRQKSATEHDMSFSNGTWTDSKGTVFPQRHTLYAAVLKGKMLRTLERNSEIITGSPEPDQTRPKKTSAPPPPTKSLAPALKRPRNPQPPEPPFEEEDPTLTTASAKAHITRILKNGAVTIPMPQDVTLLKGHDLKKIKFDDSLALPEALKAVAEKTREGHRRMIEELQKIPQESSSGEPATPTYVRQQG
eukprot:GILI01035740.1.p1 GENE.GILI01035740.1~~GILI01035740.1.p1  ORF type:complete len:374 (+),score=38.98 GILI01035740.1:252-1373(+)